MLRTVPQPFSTPRLSMFLVHGIRLSDIDLVLNYVHTERRMAGLDLVKARVEYNPTDRHLERSLA